MAAALCLPLGAETADEPFAKIAVLSNLYLTALPEGEIKDERGSSRGWLAQEGPRSMERTVALVNQLKPDAVIVLGSLTWSGSEADMAKATGYLQQIRAPLWVTPGHLDRRTGSGAAFKKRFGAKDASGKVVPVKGVQLLFAGDAHEDPGGAADRLERQLRSAGKAKAVLLFGGRPGNGRSVLNPQENRFWTFVERRRVAVRIEPTRYGHQLQYERTLPIWYVGSTAWSARGAVSVFRVYKDRIEAAEIREVSQPAYTLTVPNPVTRPRMKPAAEDPYGCPPYSEDLASKPDFTFALVSDPQFDREKNRESLIRKARAAIDELNRLSPALVLVTGDLVNNNLPEEWRLFNEVFSALKPPRTVMPGNHDVIFNSSFVEKMYEDYQSRNKEYAAKVRKAVEEAAREGFKGPTALYEKFTGQKPRQRVERKDCVFITLSLLTQRAEAGEIAHLRRELAKARRARHVFVLGHYPVLPAFGNNVRPEMGGDPVLELLSRHKVTAYLFGHRHRNGFRMHDRVAHVLSDNMGTVHVFHVFKDRVVVGRKRVGSPLYSRVVLSASRP